MKSRKSASLQLVATRNLRASIKSRINTFAKLQPVTIDTNHSPIGKFRRQSTCNHWCQQWYFASFRVLNNGTWSKWTNILLVREISVCARNPTYKTYFELLKDELSKNILELALKHFVRNWIGSHKLWVITKMFYFMIPLVMSLVNHMTSRFYDCRFNYT